MLFFESGDFRGSVSRREDGGLSFEVVGELGMCIFYVRGSLGWRR